MRDWWQNVGWTGTEILDLATAKEPQDMEALKLATLLLEEYYHNEPEEYLSTPTVKNLGLGYLKMAKHPG